MGEHTRLRWRCRRGRRELDLLLERYLDDRYEQAGAAERAGFEALLERSDPELEDLLTGRLAPESPQQARVIERIRRHG
ncbi:MAG: succinate dehydrogenase assembly factor 2 [Gammaproteobacteria bacterium]|nr:succinate dehydrogenase assembly factor 2 [Chromatiales bacterium]MYE49416.1 succinate dehydrogenase assembly factor 2 [Gammaproteobacteria bacterium]